MATLKNAADGCFLRCWLRRPAVPLRTLAINSPEIEIELNVTPLCRSQVFDHATMTTLSVVICAYTMNRWELLRVAVESVAKQSVPALETILVIDHNDELLARAEAEFVDVKVVANAQGQGLSGARNTGIEQASGEVVAFLDDDASAEREWIEHLVRCYDDADVLAVGGLVVPAWESSRPRWFPMEFDWVVGCSYRGLPTTKAEIRNPIGANMSVRRSVFAAVGGFQSQLGRRGTTPLGCEETELCIRARQHQPTGKVLHEPDAVVHHFVPKSRATVRYFHSRCRAEGLSKAFVSSLVGSGDGMSSERSYVAKVLPGGAVKGVLSLGRGDTFGPARAGLIVSGLAAFAAGYLPEWHRLRSAAPSAAAAEKVVSGQQFRPIAVADLELVGPLRLDPEPAGTFAEVRALVRIDGVPIGQLPINCKDWSAEALARTVWADLGTTIGDNLVGRGLDRPLTLTGVGLEPATFPTRALPTDRIAVVIATRNRTEILQRCLATIAAQTVRAASIIVVDNAPSDDSTEQLLTGAYGQARGITYVRENRPGLGIAHNASLAYVRDEFVAFTDDDVLAEPGWLAGLLHGFHSGHDVVCVTGMIVPAELETREQLWTEDGLGFTKGYQPRLFDMAEHRHDSALYPFAAGVLGSGANMAFRTSYLRDVGGFDSSLGTGTMARGGDDLAAFHEVIMHGHQLAYAPSAIIRHFHNKTYESVKRQMSGYGVGLTAYLTSAVVRRPTSLLSVARHAVGGVAHMVGPSSAKVQNMPTDYPGELVWAERRGMLLGPIAYARTRWERRGWSTPVG
jgi:O-antigen biosynthesis protein